MKALKIILGDLVILFVAILVAAIATETTATKPLTTESTAIATDATAEATEATVIATDATATEPLTTESTATATLTESSTATPETEVNTDILQRKMAICKMCLKVMESILQRGAPYPHKYLRYVLHRAYYNGPFEQFFALQEIYSMYWKQYMDIKYR